MSAYGFGGRPAALVVALLGGRIGAVTSVPLLTELAGKLTAVCHFDDRRVRVALSELARVAEIVEPTQRLQVVVDDADNRVLECALAGGVDLIVSGDHHLLDLGEYEGIPIVRVVEALERIGKPWVSPQLGQYR